MHIVCLANIMKGIVIFTHKKDTFCEKDFDY